MTINVNISTSITSNIQDVPETPRALELVSIIQSLCDEYLVLSEEFKSALNELVEISEENDKIESIVQLCLTGK